MTITTATRPVIARFVADAVNIGKRIAAHATAHKLAG